MRKSPPGAVGRCMEASHSSARPGSIQPPIVGNTASPIVGGVAAMNRSSIIVTPTGVRRGDGAMPVDLKDHNILVRNVYRNMPTARLYENAIARESSAITSTGALATNSGSKTGRSPRDKRIVELPTSKDDVNWGDVNIKLDEHTFLINRQRAIDFLNSREYIYVADGFAGWDPRYRINVRVICARAYHAM